MNKINPNLIGAICCAACCVIMFIAAAIMDDRDVMDNTMFLFFVPFIAMCVFITRSTKNNQNKEEENK